MPYSVDNKSDVKGMKEKLQETYKGITDKQVRQAIHVWNSVYEDSKDEGRAWASVHSTLQKGGLQKKSALHRILVSEGLLSR